MLRVSRAPRIVSGSAEAMRHTPTRVALVASWLAGGQASRSLSELIRRLRECDYEVIVTIATSATQIPEWPHGIDPDVLVMTRPNVGYDFGSWAAAMHRFPQVASSPYVLTVNDSLVGPFTGLQPIVSDFESAPTPAWGLVDSSQHYPHLQSFFVGYKDGLLAHPAVRAFWRGICIERDKWTLISRYEIGLSRLLDEHGLDYRVMFPWQEVVIANQNPSVFGWRRLLDRGFPFVKRELIQRPPDEIRDARDVSAEIESRFGQAVTQWL